MASGTPKGTPLEQAICSICLKYLTKPVTIVCGHNFCRICLTLYCEQRKPELGTELPCPQCQVPFKKGKFQLNTQLAYIVENMKQLRVKPGKAQKENLCERHQEKLQLFCEEDGKAICLVCRESWDHRAHTVLPVQEAALDYEVKLCGSLGPLKKKLAKSLLLTSKEERKVTEWQDKVENQRQLITHEFKKLHQVLHEEEQLLLQSLAEEERETLQRLQDNIKKLLEQNTTLQQLIREIEKKRLQTATDLLEDVKSTLIRSENVKLQSPGEVSLALKNVYNICLDIREMLKRFTVDVTLDPDTAHPNLVLSEDRKSVRSRNKKQDLPYNCQRFDTMAIVLGAELFTNRRCYWEVDVGERTFWILGICRESVSRKGEVGASPASGYWALWLNDGQYMAASTPPIPLTVRTRPSQVGVFLDYEAGEVSFYNVTDRSHLFTFTGTFSGTLRPYFNAGFNAGDKNAVPLTICTVPVQARENFCSTQ